MSEKTKRTDMDPQTAADQQQRRQQPGAQGTGTENKAIDEHGKLDKEKLERNQERLGVDDEHINDEMKKGDRGTYP